MKKRNKGRDFGSKMKIFLHSYNNSTSSISFQTLKPTKKHIKTLQMKTLIEFWRVSMGDNENEHKERKSEIYLT